MSNNNAIAYFILVFTVITLLGTYGILYYIDQLTVSGKVPAIQGTVNITIAGVCGDSYVTITSPLNEICESTDLQGKTCVTQGFDSGTLKCASNCTAFDTSGCTTNAVAAGAVGRPEVTERPINMTNITQGNIYSIVVNKLYPVYVIFKNVKYRLNVEIEDNKVTLIINPGDIKVGFVKGIEYGIDLDNDGKDDIVMVLDEVLARRAVFRLWSINLRTPIRPVIEKPEKGEKAKEEMQKTQGIRLDKTLVIIFIIIVILTLIIRKLRRH